MAHSTHLGVQIVRVVIWAQIALLLVKVRVRASAGTIVVTAVAAMHAGAEDFLESEESHKHACQSTTLRGNLRGEEEQGSTNRCKALA